VKRGRIHIAAVPVSNSHEKVLPPTLAITLGLILSPLRGVIRLKNFIAHNNGNSAKI
jgi:hypothetical protein